MIGLYLLRAAGALPPNDNVFATHFAVKRRRARQSLLSATSGRSPIKKIGSPTTGSKSTADVTR
jgi:hypothetical protein